jgi:hypothetical protein
MNGIYSPLIASPPMSVQGFGDLEPLSEGAAKQDWLCSVRCAHGKLIDKSRP